MTTGQEPAAEPRGTRSRENTRARLLEAAAEVFAEVGMDGASVEAICERAGFTRGAFYSNFETKDELFLELSMAFTRRRLEAVGERISEMTAADEGELTATDAAALVRILDIAGDDRDGVLLMGEIRIRAMRDPRVATSFLANEDDMVREVAQIIRDIAAAGGLVLRADAQDAARMLLLAWEGASARGVISGMAAEELARLRSEEVGRIAALLVSRPQR